MSDLAPAIPQAEQESSLGMTTAQVGMASFLCTEVAFFSTLLVAYLTYEGKSTVGPTPEALSLPIAVMNTVFLLTSSATIGVAVRARLQGRKQAFARWMFLTAALGGMFLAGTAYEWYGLIFDDGLTIGRNLFGSTFFTLIGFHALHVTLGIVTMLVLVTMDRLAALAAKSEAPELVSWYWHLVDGVWIVIVMVVYVFGR